MKESDAHTNKRVIFAKVIFKARKNKEDSKVSFVREDSTVL